jgi:hypothetical protein
MSLPLLKYGNITLTIITILLTQSPCSDRPIQPWTFPLPPYGVYSNLKAKVGSNLTKVVSLSQLKY